MTVYFTAALHTGAHFVLSDGDADVCVECITLYLGSHSLQHLTTRKHELLRVLAQCLSTSAHLRHQLLGDAALCECVFAATLAVLCFHPAQQPLVQVTLQCLQALSGPGEVCCNLCPR